jgi:hypothetical protein
MIAAAGPADEVNPGVVGSAWYQAPVPRQLMMRASQTHIRPGRMSCLRWRERAKLRVAYLIDLMLPTPGTVFR